MSEQLTGLERAVLEKLLSGENAALAVLRIQLEHARVVGRSFSVVSVSSVVRFWIWARPRGARLAIRWFSEQGWLYRNLRVAALGACPTGGHRV